MPPPNSISFTPALLGISSYYSWKVLHDRWDNLFAKMLASEDTIYFESCTAFAITRVQGRVSEPAGWAHLSVLLGDKSNPLWAENEIQPALRWAFHEYWKVARDQRYWMEGQFGSPQGYLPFEKMAGEWRTANAETVNDSRRQMESWMNGR